ncbi:Z1 domain-containing protein [Kluyvera georgiana]|uniref:Z1 domain-containing protein n=1 Tax=Kluyvera georgiana TaxID=73098 RepID=UPI00321F9375
MDFYDKVSAEQKYDEKLQKCINDVIEDLEDKNTSCNNPGVLLGKIQSGKTRGFLGIIAKAFDNDYDIALVLTKGTKTLAKQTVSRIQHDFKTFVDDDLISIFDIMEVPQRLTRSEINRKLIIVAKKEVKNLQRVISFFSNQDQDYKNILKKKVILIDDEADLGSIRFVKAKNESEQELIEQGKIAKKMDELRQLVKNLKFLQVTATPYSLYLQPENYPDPYLFLPKKPAFTKLLPIHDKYVGGDDYFKKYHNSDPRYYLYVRVPEEEQDFIRSKEELNVDDNNILYSDGIKVLTNAFTSFICAVVIRRWQQQQCRERTKKYAMIIHNDTQRLAHKKQLQLVEHLRKAFENGIRDNLPIVEELFNNSYLSLKTSSEYGGYKCPKKDETFVLFKKIISDGEVIVQRVNSDVELTSLLDPATAELRLRTQANIFIGGSLLDRGITIPNLLSFYYGRNPKRMQADTVLQHSRMYGAREKADLAVTRFYTSQNVFNRLKHVHEFDSALRKAFENGNTSSGVVFLENDSAKGVVPCSPSKISISQVLTVNPGGYFLPTDFDLSSSSKLKNYINEIDGRLSSYYNKKIQPHTVNKKFAIEILSLIKKTLILNKDDEFTWHVLFDLIDYYCKSIHDDNIEIIVERGRKINKNNSGDKSGRSIVGGQKIRELLQQQRNNLVIVFLQQEGGTQLGWSVDSNFWWPILVSPTHSNPCIYSLK